MENSSYLILVAGNLGNLSLEVVIGVNELTVDEVVTDTEAHTSTRKERSESLEKSRATLHHGRRGSSSRLGGRNLCTKVSHRTHGGSLQGRVQSEHDHNDLI